MKARVSLITLGVTDLGRARRFYETGLGWSVGPLTNDSVVFFQAGGLILALFGRDDLARDANLSDAGQPGRFGGIALAHNVRERSQVDRALERARRAGATILKPAQDAFWGGYSGYFADPDGHVWEVAWNPHFVMDAAGAVRLPE